jgi:hypothetical protein
MQYLGECRRRVFRAQLELDVEGDSNVAPLGENLVKGREFLLPELECLGSCLIRAGERRDEAMIRGILHIVTTLLQSLDLLFSDGDRIQAWHA